MGRGWIENENICSVDGREGEEGRHDSWDWIKSDEGDMSHTKNRASKRAKKEKGTHLSISENKIRVILNFEPHAGIKVEQLLLLIWTLYSSSVLWPLILFGCLFITFAFFLLALWGLFYSSSPSSPSAREKANVNKKGGLKTEKQMTWSILNFNLFRLDSF